MYFAPTFIIYLLISNAEQRNNCKLTGIGIRPNIQKQNRLKIKNRESLNSACFICTHFVLCEKFYFLTAAGWASFWTNPPRGRRIMCKHVYMSVVGCSRSFFLWAFFSCLLLLNKDSGCFVLERVMWLSATNQGTKCCDPVRMWCQLFWNKP